MTIMQTTQEGADVARTKTPTLTMFNQGRTEVLQIPTTHEEMMALMSQREQLNEQLEEVTDRRSEIMSQLRSAPPEAAQASLQSELKVLDQRVTQIHNDLSLVGREIARASPELIAMTKEPEDQPIDDHFAQGAAAGGASVFVLMSAFFVFARRRWRRTGRAGSPVLPAADSERLQRVENGMEAMAIEIERISENQRFVTKLLSESRAAESAPR